MANLLFRPNELLSEIEALKGLSASFLHPTSYQLEQLAGDIRGLVTQKEGSLTLEIPVERPLRTRVSVGEFEPKARLRIVGSSQRPPGSGKSRLRNTRSRIRTGPERRRRTHCSSGSRGWLRPSSPSMTRRGTSRLRVGIWSSGMLTRRDASSIPSRRPTMVSPYRGTPTCSRRRCPPSSSRLVSCSKMNGRRQSRGRRTRQSAGAPSSASD